MRSEKLTAAIARVVRRWGRTDQSIQDRGVPMTAVGALAAGMLLSVGFLAVTESRAPATAPDVAEMTVASESRSDDFSKPSTLEREEAISSQPHVTEPNATDDVRWFNNRPIRPVKTLSMLVTAYSPDERSCGEWADGVTASGYSVWTNGMKLVAADTSVLPFGSLVSVPDYDEGDVVPVLDRGGAIRGNRLDVLYPTHERALEWGAQRLEVTIWEYADGEPCGFRQQHRRR